MWAALPCEYNWQVPESFESERETNGNRVAWEMERERSRIPAAAVTICLRSLLAWTTARQLLFDLRQNAFHLFFAECAQRLTLGVTERAVL